MTPADSAHGLAMLVGFVAGGLAFGFFCASLWLRARAADRAVADLTRKHKEEGLL